uniref:Uncharacterized protein n=1 Tax=Vespula pensylvanica TaxID=30213 RepID=A0A834P7X8_VESPE|nr:hypothetical protein H0235_004646 [Vespula pensylvanica]
MTMTTSLRRKEFTDHENRVSEGGKKHRLPISRGHGNGIGLKGGNGHYLHRSWLAILPLDSHFASHSSSSPPNRPPPPSSVVETGGWVLVRISRGKNAWEFVRSWDIPKT